VFAAEICGGQQQLASWLRVTPNHLARWIEGHAQPPPDANTSPVSGSTPLASDLITVKACAGPCLCQAIPLQELTRVVLPGRHAKKEKDATIKI
jgi:hypothetical protein